MTENAAIPFFSQLLNAGEEEMDAEQVLDCRGLACPQPVIQTRQALDRLEGSCLRVILDNEGSCINVRRFAESQGHAVTSEETEGAYHVRIAKGAGGTAAVAPAVVCDAAEGRRTVVYVSSEGIGRGDDVLGHKLMAAYLDTLAQFAPQVSHVILINAGVKLAVDGSPVLDQIRNLERMGAQVFACGTCLNHFGIADRLHVGSVSNMLAILEVLSAAERVLSL
jgi:selenium metabolism protein YedF